jgi:hypothetical protein
LITLMHFLSDLELFLFAAAYGWVIIFLMYNDEPVSFRKYKTLNFKKTSQLINGSNLA